jgi:hypothetical protein
MPALHSGTRSHPVVAHDAEISMDKVAFYRVAWQNVGKLPAG